MKKKVVSCLLAAAMVVSSGAAVPGFFFTPEKVQAEENDTKAEKENLALKGTAAASEAEADSTSAAKYSQISIPVFKILFLFLA